MAELVNIETGRIENIPDVEVHEALASGGYSFERGTEVPVVRGVDRGYLPAEQAIRVLNDPTSGYKFETQESRNRQELEDRHGTVPQRLATLAEGFGRTATLGLSDFALTKAGVPGEDIAARREVNPVMATTAEIGGLIAPTFSAAPRAIKALGFGARGLDKAGRKVQKEVLKLVQNRIKNPVARQAVGVAARGGFEGASLGVAESITEASLGNSHFNAETLMTRVGVGAAVGVGAGAVFGAGGEKAARAIRTANKRLSDTLKRVAGILPDDPNIRLQVEPNQLRLTNTPNVTGGRSIVANYDEETGFYVYEDSIRRAFIDVMEAGPGQRILTRHDPETLRYLGTRVGVPDLAEQVTKNYNPKTQNLLEFVEDAVLRNSTEAQSLNVVGVKDIKKRVESARRGARRVQEKVLQLRKQVANGQTAKRPQLEKQQKKLNNLMKGYRRLNKEYENAVKKIATDKDQASRVEGLRSIVQREFMGVEQGGRLFVSKPETLTDAIKFAESTKGVRGQRRLLTISEQQALAMGGAGKKFYRDIPPAKQKEIAKVLRESFRTPENKKLFSNRLFTDTDDLFENLHVRRTDALNRIDSSMVEAENYFLRNNLDTGVSGKVIADKIRNNVIKRYVNAETGSVMAGYKSYVNYAERFANDTEQFTRRMLPDGTFTQRNLTPMELRDLRIEYDALVKDFNKKNHSMNEGLIRKVRSFMEEEVEKSLETYGDTAARQVLQTYRSGKKDFGIVSDALKLVEDQAYAQQARSNVGFGGWVGGGAALVAGTIAGGVTGGMIGLGAGAMSGHAMRRFGRPFQVLYADGILRTSVAFSDKMTSSLSKFFQVTADPARVALVAKAPQYGLTEYFKDRERLEKGELSAELMVEKFQRENEEFIANMPETSQNLQETVFRAQSFLLNKFPKSSYESGFDRPFTPTEAALAKFDRYRQAVKDPMHVLSQIEEGYVNAETIETLKYVYPTIREAMGQEVLELIQGKELNYMQRQMINRVFGIETNFYQKPQTYLKLNNLRLQQQHRESNQFLATQSTIAARNTGNRVEESMTPAQRMMRPRN